MPPITLPSGRTETLEQTKKRARELTSVPAASLTEPVEPVNVPEPAQASISPQAGRLVNNITRDVNGFIEAQTQEAKDLRDLQSQYAALSDQTSLSDLFKTTQEQYGVTPESLGELKDIQLQLTDMDTASELTKTRIEGAAGQTLGQAQREVTQEDREAAVRSAGLAARAAVIQGNIETANAAATQAVNIAYQERQLNAQNLINQINMMQGRVDEQTGQLLEQEKRDYEAELASIQELKDATASAMVSGATQAEIRQLTDPTIDDATKLALANEITARGATELRNLDIAQAQASINASNASARSSAANAALKEEELAQIVNAGNDPAEVQNTLDNFVFLRDAADNVINLSGGASPNPTAEFLRRNIGSSSTENTQLQGYVDTLRANMLTLATDPTIKEFFGPQMSDADVRLMTAAGSNLRPDEQTPAQLKAEAMRIDDWLNRAETAVREGSKGNNTTPNTITAPDGTLIEIID